MTIKDIHILESLKKIRPKDLIYSGILTLFIITVVIIFFISTRFISQNINRVFSSEGGESVQALDLTRYMLTTKKLGIAVNISSENSGAPETIPLPLVSAPTIPTKTVPDKQALTIEVRNSTAKKGVAGSLASLLKEAGFSAPSIGNEKTLYPKTTILVKESKYDYAPLLLETVLRSYPGAFATTTPESALFDASIVIGAE